MYLENLKNIYIDDYAKLLGELCMNRVASIAYKNIKGNLLTSFPKQFVDSLYAIYKMDCSRNLWFRKCILYMERILQNVSFKYALLKGAYLIPNVYPLGCRNSNDIDILLDEKDISNCQDVLIENGFVQGFYNPQQGIVPASRKDIVFSRINYGETIPFCKQIDNEVLMIDLNFSLDFKPEGKRNLVREMLSDRKKVIFQDGYYYSLSDNDFLIHLCCHLYKEATTMNWVAEKRDLDLYKFSDINVLMMNVKYDYEKLFERVIDLEVSKEFYFALYYTLKIYVQLTRNDALNNILRKLEPKDKRYLDFVFDPKSNQYYQYKQPFIERFNCKNREELLEVYMDE
nr:MULTISPECIES: nucleotidyltransferase family protein [Blautia]